MAPDDEDMHKWEAEQGEAEGPEGTGEADEEGEAGEEGEEGFEEGDEEFEGEFDIEYVEGEFDDEVQVSIEPRMELLEQIGASIDEFEEALAKALEQYHATIEGMPAEAEVPMIEDAPITLKGKEYTLEHLAEIVVLDDDEEYDEEEYDDEELEEDGDGSDDEAGDDEAE